MHGEKQGRVLYVFSGMLSPAKLVKAILNILLVMEGKCAKKRKIIHDKACFIEELAFTPNYFRRTLLFLKS